MNDSIHSSTKLFHRRHKSNGNSTSSMSKYLLTATISVPNKHLSKRSEEDAARETTKSIKNLSNKHKTISLEDDCHQRLRPNQNRRNGKSVLEYLIFILPENIQQMSTESKK